MKKFILIITVLLVSICFTSCVETCEGECEIIGGELICPC